MSSPKVSYVFAAYLAGMAILLNGLLVLLGWLCNANWVSLGSKPMQPGTAIAMILIGVALYGMPTGKTNQTYLLSRVCAFLAGLVSLLALCAYFVLGEALHSFCSTPGAALSVLLLCAALLCLPVASRQIQLLASYLVLLAGAIPLLTLFGYVYGAGDGQVRMSLNTALTIPLACLGTLCLQYDQGLMAVVTSDSAGGTLARRLILPALTIPLILGWVISRLVHAPLLGEALQALVVTGVMLGLVWRTSRLLHQMELERRQIQDLVHLRELASKLTLAEEQERRKIAATLHDGICQVMTIARIMVDRLHSQAEDSQVRKQLDEVLQLLSQAIEAARTLTFETSPGGLYESGLEPALQQLAEKIQEQTGILCVCQTEGEPQPLNEAEVVTFYRAAREAVINAVKHARARQITIQLAQSPSYVRVKVLDDGVGLDPAKVFLPGATKSGFGLRHIRERFNQLGGAAIISSQPGHGTEIVLRLPLPGMEKPFVGEHI